MYWSLSAVPIHLGHYVFHFDLFLLSLTGFGAVLGVNGLRTLGAIMWNFNLMHMTFSQHGQRVELQGIQKSRPVIASNFLLPLQQLTGT